MGIDFSTDANRLYCRQQVLQQSVGLVDIFEKRMSLPPHSLIACLSDDEDWIKSTLDHLFTTPRLCLPIWAQRFIDMFPNALAARSPAAKSILVKFFNWTEACIDFSERSHAQMRTDLSSSGPVRSLPSSGNRVLCNQAKAEHIRRGGEDPKKKKKMQLGFPTHIGLLSKH